MNQFEKGFIVFVQDTVLVICLVFWLIVGFGFWLPFLSPAVAIYCAGMVAAAISNADIRHLKQLLDHAIEFYPEGFRRILEHHRNASLRGASPGSYGSRLVDWDKVRTETFWTLAFWTIIIVSTILLRQCSP
jgi:hypothetical protein